MNTEIKRVGLHHSFDVDLSIELKSVELAIMTHHFQLWIRHNASNNRNFHEGRTWTYQTLKDVATYFPYWSIKQVERFINKLVELKILVKGNFNKSPYDRTLWYAFGNEEKFSISRNREIENPESGNQNPEIGTPIPCNNTDKKKKKKNASLPSIHFDYETKQFSGITDADMADWQQLYPNVNIKFELDAMRQWLLEPSNPERDGNRSFINKWLKKVPKNSKPSKSSETPNPEASAKPYNSSIAYSILRKDGLEEYIDYLKWVSDPHHYQDYLAGNHPEQIADLLRDKGVL